jgi:hypothetical protein
MRVSTMFLLAACTVPAVHRVGLAGEFSIVEVNKNDAEQRDPDAAFRNVCARLVALEAKHKILKGLADVKPVVERDAKEGPKSGTLVFERNAVPPGKEDAKARDNTKPFVYVSVQFWSGRSQQPPADLYHFEWKGQKYQMWVRVFGSDADLVKALRQATREALDEPPAAKN